MIDYKTLQGTVENDTAGRDFDQSAWLVELYIANADKLLDVVLRQQAQLRKLLPIEGDNPVAEHLPE